MLRIREKAKIDPRRKRFALLDYPQLTGPAFLVLVDRDAETEFSLEKNGRHVARIHKAYARAVVNALNFVNTDYNALLALRPAKRQKNAVPLCQERDPTNNAWWSCSRPRGHQGGCRFDRKAPKR